MYVSRRVLALATLLATLLLPVGHGNASDPAVYGAGVHTEGMTKVLHMPDGTVLTVGQLTTAFSIDNDHATCMVGEVGGSVAPLNMVMYTTSILSRTFGTTPEGAVTYTISGLVRSITMAGSVVLEDVNTPFEVTAFDGDPTGAKPAAGDFFHMTIDTSLWPHQTFGKDVTGESVPIFAGDIAIGHPIAEM